MTVCSWAACIRPATHTAGGWKHCEPHYHRHLREYPADAPRTVCVGSRHDVHMHEIRGEQPCFTCRVETACRQAEKYARRTNRPPQSLKGET